VVAVLTAAAFLASAGASSAAPSATPGRDEIVRSAFSDAEIFRAVDECSKGKADFRKYFNRWLEKPSAQALPFVTPDYFGLDVKPYPPASHPYELALACLELAGDSKWSCEFLSLGKGHRSKFSGDGPFDGYEGYYCCSEVRKFSSIAWGVLRGGKAGAIPQSFLSEFVPESVGLPNADKERILRLLTQAFKTGDAAALCSELAAKKLGVSDPAECGRDAAFFSGDPARCSGIKHPNDRDSCQARASLLAALRSPDPKACAASPLCDAQARRQSAACAPLLKPADASFCRMIGLVKGPAVTREADKRAAEAKQRAQFDEVVRREKEKVAAFNKRRMEEEKVLREKVAAAEVLKAQEAAAKKRAEDEKVVRAREEKARKKQFQAGQRMQSTPADALKVIEAVNQGKKGPPARRLPNEGNR
jgi:hypothetical protein